MFGFFFFTSQKAKAKKNFFFSLSLAYYFHSAVAVQCPSEGVTMCTGARYDIKHACSFRKEEKKHARIQPKELQKKKKMNKGGWKAQKLRSQHIRRDEKGRQWNNIVGKGEC